MGTSRTVRFIWLAALLWACPGRTGEPTIAARADAAGQPISLEVVAIRGPIEEDLGLGTTGLLRSSRWWYKRIYYTLQGSTRTWWRWSSRIVLLMMVAVVASMLDRNLWQQWRIGGWGVFRHYMPLAGIVYLLALFDRRADGLGRILLFGAFAYGLLPFDLVPDKLNGGMIDDLVLVAGSSRLFMHRCPAALIEHRAKQVQGWRRRTQRIQARRRSLRRRIAGE